MALLGRIDQLPLAHFAIDRLGGRLVADKLLGRFPIKRRLAGSGVTYRHRYLDTFMIADEIFRQGLYRVAGIESVRTFADLGCNVGYFVAWLADHTGSRDLRGVAVDADERLVRETQWIVDANSLRGVHPVCGLVGVPGGPSRQEFFISPVGPRSTRFPDGVDEGKHGGAWKKVEVQAIDVEATWRSTVGDIPCDLLKIDIEGGEADFIRPDNPFLSRVDKIILEWHAWVIGQHQIDERLSAMGFEKVSDLSSGSEFGVSYYRRASRPPN